MADVGLVGGLGYLAHKQGLLFPKEPKVAKAKEPEEVELDQVQARGASGRTILAGDTEETKTKKKTILGG